ncbi:hypothetical protein AX14_011449 [Amanita brunnescens Koide BX004]|nr:hypothetical protein AX14_011449 [Amanita brunnescens Koide BX004]
MDPQQSTSNPAGNSTENEHHEVGSPGEQLAPMSQGAPQSAPLQEEVTQGPFQSSFLASPRPSQGPVPPLARPTSSNTFADAEKSEVEAMPTISYRGIQGDVPVDARVGRHATLRPVTSERVYTGLSAARRSTIDYLVPVEQQQSVAQRIEPTLKHARDENSKLNLKAKSAKWSINIASGLQVFFGALTTGVAAMRLDGKQLGIATTVLGIMTTLVGAFLTKVRAEGEPEQSMIQAHDLNLFVRRCEVFQTDHGHEFGDRFTDDIKQYREELETILRRKGSDEP